LLLSVIPVPQQREESIKSILGKYIHLSLEKSNELEFKFTFNIPPAAAGQE
jgi:hypothetical protein